MTVHKYKFEDYGIPQARHRIIIVGIKKELNLKFKVPKPNYKTMTAKEALSNISANAHNNELTKNSKKELYEKIGLNRIEMNAVENM